MKDISTGLGKLHIGNDAGQMHNTHKLSSKQTQ